MIVIDYFIFYIYERNYAFTQFKRNMWLSIKKDIDKDIVKYKISQNDVLLTCQEVIELLIHSKEFVIFFIDLLRTSSYDSFFWEVRPMTIETFDEEFEFVLVNSTALSGAKADNSQFINYFEKDKLVVSFSNLKGDARLVVPVEFSNSDNYSHLANFIRKAPEEQVQLFWKTVGEEYKKLLGDEEKWLSTSGLGVYWLHVRIDNTPKYYRYYPYRNFI